MSYGGLLFFFLLAPVVSVLSATPDAEPVEIALFYEALCPYCSRFIKYQMYPAWNKLKDTGILKVNLYPYGNAKAYKDGERWRFRCQHGSRECALNLLTTCALKKMGDDWSKKMKFVNCLEKNPYTSWGSYCARVAGHSDAQEIIDCTTSLEGNEAQKAIADIQAKLDPRLRYVPWIVVNGEHTKSVQSAVQKNMVKYVCDHYQGTKPSECY